MWSQPGSSTELRHPEFFLGSNYMGNVDWIGGHVTEPNRSQLPPSRSQAGWKPQPSNYGWSFCWTAPILSRLIPWSKLRCDPRGSSTTKTLPLQGKFQGVSLLTTNQGQRPNYLLHDSSRLNSLENLIRASKLHLFWLEQSLPMLTSSGDFKTSFAFFDRLSKWSSRARNLLHTQGEGWGASLGVWVGRRSQGGEYSSGVGLPGFDSWLCVALSI